MIPIHLLPAIVDMAMPRCLWGFLVIAIIVLAVAIMSFATIRDTVLPGLALLRLARAVTAA